VPCPVARSPSQVAEALLSTVMQTLLASDVDALQVAGRVRATSTHIRLARCPDAARP
jgi:hypothetical protein